MIREMLRAKIHRITVTESDLEYEGSITIDADLMAASGMVPYEKVEVYNIDGGERFTTYVIEGPPASGVCCVNGAAAHLADPGDKVIVCAYCGVDETELSEHRPIVVLVGENNRIRSVQTGSVVRWAPEGSDDAEYSVLDSPASGGRSGGSAR